MTKRIRAYITEFLSSTASSASKVNDVDVREEYANAFRTESYNEFWTRVLALSCKDSASCIPLGFTAARLPSYRLFAEHLLDPDQPKVTKILALTRNQHPSCALLSDYFIQTANAFRLCGNLLRDIDHTRVKFRSLKKTLKSLETVDVENHAPAILTRLAEFTNSVNLFAPFAPSPSRVRLIQASCSLLLNKLETSRDKIRAKLRLANKLKHGSALFLVTLTASLTVIVATHAIALLVATPSLIAASLEFASTRRLARVSAQLDTATKGTFIMNKDLDTISRHVTRVNDDIEHMRAMGKFWVERGEDRLHTSYEVARQVKMNDASFSDQLDELEEHLYLCFMTINRARNIVVKEILDPGQPTRSSYIL
ncbi:UPF0496 protein At3g49070 isoform X2 [Tripterygium wilfordii]|uniref:UPF0496 protein At3g49070 isoform X2 n=1 Tax=Tripterygium wilfordii TaxID=458696 RepID=UPI0018F81219|nr:UPF0496 protein At3g49070 isoform X2 [Tripterygium wilfordii]XP_038709751.1 UPF0496 protein At3g49070 isoform X2 [Tripterygium wilfordii]